MKFEWHKFQTCDGTVFEHKDYGEVDGEYVSEVRFGDKSRSVHVPLSATVAERMTADCAALRELGVIDPETGVINKIMKGDA